MSDTETDTTYYAWAPIIYGAEVDKDSKSITKTLRVEINEVVTPDKIGLDADSNDWKELIAGGAIRVVKFPDELQDPNTSPQKIAAAKIAAAQEGVDSGVITPEMIQLVTTPTSVTEGNKEVTDTGDIIPPENTPPPTPSTPSGSGLPQ